MPEPSLLSLQALCCHRGDRPLLTDISLEVKPGEIYRIAGPNGSGKTTLLRTVAGLRLPFSGNITWDNQAANLNNARYTSALRHVGHNNALKGDLTVAENLQFQATLLGLNDIKDHVDHALDYFALAPKKSTPVAELSQGQQRKAGLARLMLGPSAIWILDEPFTSLDQQASALLENLINEHLSNNGSALIATHQNLANLSRELQTLDLESYHA